MVVLPGHHLRNYECISYFQAGQSDEASMDYARGLSGILEELHLLLIILEDWILIQRASIDIHINEEPYHSIQVYANTMTKKYVVRAWGRSIKSGELGTAEDLKMLCLDYFGRLVACAGYLGPHPGQGLDLVRVSYPCTRWISRSCAVTFAHDQDALIVGLCSACSGEKLMRKEEVETSLPIDEKKNINNIKRNPNITAENTLTKPENGSPEDPSGEPGIALEKDHSDASDDDTWSPPKPKPKEAKKKLKPTNKNSENTLKKRKRLKGREKENGRRRLQVRFAKLMQH